MMHQRVESLPHHGESSALIPASPDRVFALIDDHERLASHMSSSSWRMGGGHMTTSVDDGLGRRVGSHIWMSGASHLAGAVARPLVRPLLREMVHTENGQ